mgnify:CR=1 FL=1
MLDIDMEDQEEFIVHQHFVNEIYNTTTNSISIFMYY